MLIRQSTDDPNAAYRAGQRVHALAEDGESTLCGRDVSGLVPVRVDPESLADGSDAVCRVCANNYTPPDA